MKNVIRLFEEAEADTGGLDIVHNNAGIMTGLPDLPDTVMERMIAIMQINLLAMMVGTRKAIEQMRARQVPGVIINTASVAVVKILQPVDIARAVQAMIENDSPEAYYVTIQNGPAGR